MEYLVSDLKHQPRGAVVEFVLRGNAANVMLLDGPNLANYKRGRSFRYVGGHAKRSPARLTVPRSGHWYAVVDLGGHAGRVNASVRVLPGALPALRQAAGDVAAVADNFAADENLDNREFDVFVAHASEDKDAVVRPLAARLQDRGLRVWYDEFQMRVGDSLRRKVDRGVARSRFGVVVLSPAFFAKNWTQYELDGLVTREMHGGEQIILPLWHNISKAEVIAQSPSLADKIALRTSDVTVEEIAEQIVDVVVARDTDADAA